MSLPLPFPPPPLHKPNMALMLLEHQHVLLHPQLEKDLYLIVQLEMGFAPHRYNLKISLMQILKN